MRACLCKISCKIIDIDKGWGYYIFNPFREKKSSKSTK